MTRLPILTTEELRAVESRAARVPGPTLMERAGRATAEAARRLARDDGSPILVVAGPGNNGGDAWVAAAHLAEAFHRVLVFDVTGSAPPAVEARAAQSAFRARGGQVIREWPGDTRLALIVDGLLGIGLGRNVEGAFAQIVVEINASDAPVLAIDVPSGLDSDSGCVRGIAVKADRTLTFIARKPGLFTADGVDHCGVVDVDTLGLPEETFADARGKLLVPEQVRGLLHARPRNSHKGTFGTLGIVGGNRGMVGAALLAARAGLYLGAGKVYVGLLSADAPTVDPEQPELMMRTVDDAMAADVLVVGPGAGRSPSATSVSMFERTVLPNAIASTKPLVLDADALNVLAYSEALAEAVAARRQGPTILTPHPAEAARLLRCDNDAVRCDRVGSALELSRRFGAHIVLKGAGSVCAFPDGRWSINATGNPGLASGGTGDVLAGMIGALLCQDLRGDEALEYAVCLHGAAADRCVAEGNGPAGLTASEVARMARRLMNAWTASLTNGHVVAG
ncbi:MAG: NAD(P)H-hydrate dehydratase [Bacillota bacterium]